MRQGLFHAAFPFTFPQVMGYDVSGVVLSAPADSSWKVGDEVYARLPNRTPGAYAERVAVPQDLLARKPAKVSHEEAASLPTVALPIQAGAGWVGSFAIQLAKHMGAVVTATGGPGNEAWMKDLGAHRIVGYTCEKFEDAGPYYVVYDGICGPLIERGIDRLRRGGRYVGLVRTADKQSYREMGFPEPIATQAAAAVQPYIDRARARAGEFHGPLTRPDGAQLAAIVEIIDSGAIRPTVTGTYGLDALAEAYTSLASGRTRGKLVLVL
jgi:NADPH:quinone reductase-like Zn-dependent oxidoreductase